MCNATLLGAVLNKEFALITVKTAEGIKLKNVLQAMVFWEYSLKELVSFIWESGDSGDMCM